MAIAAGLVFGAGMARAIAATAPASDARNADRLTLAELTGGAAKGPVRMSAFTRPSASAAPTQRFEGRLILSAEQLAGGFEVLRNQPYGVRIDDQTRSLPPFDFAFIQDADAIIPVQRGPIASAHPDWELVLEPGRAWDEPGDQGYSRASLPFALQERNANCLHNGVLTFAYRSDGAISDVFFQMSSETCAYFKFNAWGLVKARYEPGAVEGAAAIASAYRQEVAARLPVRPLSALLAAHPQLSAAGFALGPPADSDPPSVYGVVVDGVNYVGGCETRAGPYPYCDVLDLPSYSTAKTIVGAVALMRLEKLWPGASSALIADYVPPCATDDWKDVTFEDALDMTTGVYDSPSFEADENSDDTDAFFNAETHALKIDFACRHYHHKSAPGVRWVYRTSDAYVLGTAMQAYVRQHLGPDADLYDTLLAGQLWRPEHLSPPMMSTLRTRDAARQPLVGFGLTYHADDAVRLARFLDVDEGKIGGEAMLDAAVLRRAMQRDPLHRGMRAEPGFDYVDGVWGRDLAPVLKCSAPAWTPFMSGYGGISIVMLAGDVQYYYFGDSQVWDWSPAAVEINKLRPICR